MRMTIPKSQGKQPYYDARKSSWGDIFPHAPKNPPQERFIPETSDQPRKGQDIGKQSQVPLRTSKHSYSKVADDLKMKQKMLRKERRRQVKDDPFEPGSDATL
jgi:ribosomal protein RSM22 (predicted rRNA methylase)